jgi:hypothetical protein
MKLLRKAHLDFCNSFRFMVGYWMFIEIFNGFKFCFFFEFTSLILLVKKAKSIVEENLINTFDFIINSEYSDLIINCMKKYRILL